MEHFGVTPSEEQLAAFAEIPLLIQEALESRKETHVLVAVFPISILDIREMDDSLFSPAYGWDDSKGFAKNKGKAGWQLIRKTPTKDSTDKYWSKQQELLGKDEEVPSAQVMVYTIIGYYKNTDERLFEWFYVRTSSGEAFYKRLFRHSYIVVGAFNSLREGLCIGFSVSDYARRDIGLASGLKL